MASPTTVTPDTLITIKISSFNGASRRFKLPLRDLGINTLETKMRGILNIPADTDAVFERYSDSAAAYVVLDKANPSVYKQLGRAAKAKLKLKMRVTIKEPVIEEKKSPKPASVEDFNEEEASTPRDAPEAESAPTPVVSPSSSTVPQETHDALPTKVVDQAVAEVHMAAMENTLDALQAKIKAATGNPPYSVCQQPARTNFAICCNQCDDIILGSHFHCSACDDGDYDLCQACVDQGMVCNSPAHWLIKRVVENGVIVNSTTERLAPKPKPKPKAAEEASPAPPVVVSSVMAQERIVPIFNDTLYSSIRTCNCCVQELPEVEFVHCTTCDDFDLCRACFAKNRHGHHPKHAFVPAVEGTRLEPEVSRRLAAGRDQRHNAICDGCDEDISGIRHKCLDCPDWDYCSTCFENAHFIHPGHRFVSVFEPLELPVDARMRAMNRHIHAGICCDGPLCKTSRTMSSYIVGDRYKCAVCHDTDFCANCEASPANEHNKTHPLIKFKTPVRHVSVSTSGEHENGRMMPTMGDRPRPRPSVTSSRSTETCPANVLFTGVHTVVDVKPSEQPAPAAPVAPVTPKEKSIKVEEAEEKPLIDLEAPATANLDAVFVREAVNDGSIFGPNHVFSQTWVLRNNGTVPWPLGCSVKYTGGDYMGQVDTSHPAATQELEMSSESTICNQLVAPGEEFPFTVLLRTPQRAGRIVSNWRLGTKEGMKFGHRLWCDVEVRLPKVPEPAEQPMTRMFPARPIKKEPEPEPQQSQMVFPKLEKESPVASIHEESTPEAASTPAPAYEEEYEDCADDDTWAEEDSEGFMTDEEYDILDASDEEFHEGQPTKK